MLTTHETLLKILSSMKGSNSVVLVGGQCLLIWAMYYESQGHQGLQVATQDIDLIGTNETVKKLEKLLDTRASIPGFDDATPELGVLRVPISNGHKLTIDILGTIAGLSKTEIEKYSVTIDIMGVSAKVLNPVGMLKSRIANVISLRRTDTHSMKQLDVSIKILHHFINTLLDSGYRFARKEVSDILHMAEHKDGVALYKRFSVDILESIPKKHKNYPDEFVNRHLAACIARIEKKRASRI